jgi:mannose-6-phosphate isomerase-like protein (cupin superfamily)
VAPDVEHGVDRRRLVPPEEGSTLALETIRLGPGASIQVADDLHDTLCFLANGTCALDTVSLDGPGAGLVAAGRRWSLVGGADGATVLRVTLGSATDLHAPMGPAEPVIALDHVEPGKATGARSFQVLYGPHNGSTRATIFVGYIPPGAAPWHYHLYDEICWIWRGPGRYHLGEEVEPLEDRCCFRITPRQVHIVENTSTDRELAILGIFTPAGSPSAAYLTPDVSDSYEFGGS